MMCDWEQMVLGTDGGSVLCDWEQMAGVCYVTGNRWWECAV